MQGQEKTGKFFNIKKETVEFIDKQKINKGIGKGATVDMAIDFYSKYSEHEEKIATIIKKK